MVICWKYSTYIYMIILTWGFDYILEWRLSVIAMLIGYIFYFFISFMLYPAHSRIGRGNLVLRHYTTFCRILEALGIEWRNSTPRFATRRSPLEEIKYLFTFIFSFPRSGVEAMRWESGKRSILTLSSLCLPWCVRDTAWKWLFFLFLLIWKY